jgi:hypothetical protein
VADTSGSVLAVIVHAGASGIARRGEAGSRAAGVGRFPRSEPIRADGAYGGELVERVKALFGWVPGIAERPNVKEDGRGAVRRLRLVSALKR